MAQRLQQIQLNEDGQPIQYGNVEYNKPNILDNIYNNILYPHYRNYYHQFKITKGQPSTKTERNYTERELQPLRQAIYNKEYELNNIPDLNQKIQTIRKYIAKNDGIKETPLLKRYMERTIDYPNYKQSYVTDDYGNRVKVNFNTANNDQYARAMNNNDFNFLMQGAIGAADYDIDDNGNVILKDRYDFTQDKLGDHTHYNIPAMIGKMFGKPYDIRINLGNINDWKDMEYTGNNLLDNMYYDITRG